MNGVPCASLRCLLASKHIYYMLICCGHGSPSRRTFNGGSEPAGAPSLVPTIHSTPFICTNYVQRATCHHNYRAGPIIYIPQLSTNDRYVKRPSCVRTMPVGKRICSTPRWNHGSNSGTMRCSSKLEKALSSICSPSPGPSFTVMVLLVGPRI